MRYLFLTMLWLTTSFVGYTQIPAGYYSDAIGKKKALLKTALHQKVKTATVLSYGGGDGKTWSGFAQTDVRTDGSVWDMYSNVVRQFNGNLAVTGMNIEHSFAKSWWGGTETQAYKDLHHLNPSDATANQRKSSYIISIVDTVITYDNGVIKVGKTKRKPGQLFFAWEPSDEYKGDFARSYMYMVTAYEDYAPLWTNDSEHLLDNNSYPVFEKWILDILLDWTRQDPISAKEIARNNIIYSIQGNRNPYIDYPLMAEYVWGNRIYMPFTENGIVSYPYLSYPNINDTVIGQQIYLQQTGELRIPIKANNLTGSLSFNLSGANAASYTLSRTSITKSEAESGTELSISVTGQSAAELKALLTVSGGGITTTAVNLITQMSDNFIALPASNISTTGFNANWTIAPNATGYQIDVFSLQPSGTFTLEKRIEEDFTFTLPNTWTREGYTDQATAGTIRLASTNTNGKVNLPPLNLSENGARITAIARQYSNDNAAKLTFLANNTEVTTWTTAVGNQTFTTDISSKTASTVLSFSAIAGKRLYVDYIKVEELMPVMNTIPVNSFTLNGSFTVSYQISGLRADSTYYFKVTPVGIQNPTASNTIKVRTDITTSTSRQLTKSEIAWKVADKKLIVCDLLVNSSLRLFDTTGRLNAARTQSTTEATFILPKKGIYFLWINSKNGIEKIKIVN
jgi:endonuclease I